MVDASQGKELPTIWEVPEALWFYVVAILIEAYPPKRVGRPRGSFRSVLNGIIYRFRTGAQWNHLPKEFGDDSTIHRWFQRWCEDGVFRRIWAPLIEKCDELGGVDWQWQAADGRMGKARFGGDKTGRNPTDRGNAGTKISLVTEAAGGPLGITIAGANVHDAKLLAETLDAIVVERPQPTQEAPQNLCLDKGYDNPTGHAATAERNYVPHIRRIGEEKLDQEGKKHTQLVVGLWNGHWRGFPSAGAFSSGTIRTGRITWDASNSPVRSCGSEDFVAYGSFEIVT